MKAPLYQLGPLLTFALTLALVSCHDRPPVPPLPTPAELLTGEGRYLITVGQVQGALRSSLLDHRAHDFVIHAYRVPAETSWAKVTDYYDKAVGDSWRPAPDITATDPRYRVRAWRHRDRLQRHNDVLAVALVETLWPGEESSFHVLLVAEPLD